MFAVSDVDFHFLLFAFQFVFFCREFFGFGEAFLGEVGGIGFAGQFQVALKLAVDVLMPLLKLCQLGLERAQRFLFLGVGRFQSRLDDLGTLPDLADDLEDELIHCVRRDIAQRAGRRLAFLADVVADVINVSVAVLILFAAGFRSELVAALTAADQTFQERFINIALQKRLAVSLFAAQGFIGGSPQLRRDNRRVLAFVFVAVVTDDPFVNRVRHNNLDLVGDEPLTADHFFLTVTSADGALRSPASFRIQRRGDFGRAFQFLAQLKNASSYPGFFRVKLKSF